MIITKTITKKLLENIIHQTFLKFGNISCSSLLDSLKLLGFSYATTSGISITIEDLKIPKSKKEFIEQATVEINEVSKKWEEGFLSDTERFQTIIDSWNIATESLKDKIIDYYKNYDPTNNLYIMAFSGARGNMSQVRQLVGMRGLMSDQEGKIIDLPIKSNFREGLSSIDYIISSYGARKGIVDTALKTADSGYLTRRLIYLSQELIIRQKDCESKEGVIFLLEKNSTIKNLVGRFLISRKNFFDKKNNWTRENNFLTSNSLILLKQEAPLILNIRSSLTCNANGSICQNCYGWDLSQGKLIGLGEAVGIIAAQSIGEPGTQLTMRTFHTGGIFAGELGNQVNASFSGKLIFPSSFNTIPSRTSHGIVVLKLQQEMSLFLINWKGKSIEIFLDIGSLLYITNSSFIKKGQLIAESINQSIIPGGKKLKPIISSLEGEIRFENLLVRKIYHERRTLKVNQNDVILWLFPGKLFLLPKEIYSYFPQTFTNQKAFSSLYFVFPFGGIASFLKKKIIIISQKKKFLIDSSQLKFETKNIFTKLFLFLKNYQYIDPFTIFGSLNFFSNYEGKIYLIRQKNSKYQTTFFIVTEEDIWKIESDQVNNFSFYQEKKALIRAGTILNSTAKLTNSGFFLKKDGIKMVFQSAFPIFLSRGAILNYKQGDFILPKKIVASLVNYTQQTEDIVQGLPKIEELIEARKLKEKAYLTIRPGVLLHNSSKNKKKGLFSKRLLRENVINCTFKEILSDSKIKKNDEERHLVSIIHSIFLKVPIVVFQNRIYKIFLIPTVFSPFIKSQKKEDFCKNKRGDRLVIKGKSIRILLKGKKLSTSIWTPIKEEQKENQNQKNFVLSYFTENKLKYWGKRKLDSIIYKNKKEDLLLLSEEKGFVYLEYLNPLVDYSIPFTSKTLYEPGYFIDIGEPFTEGSIDIHELLHIFFEYHSVFDGIMMGSLKGVHKFQLLLVHSIQAIYKSQGINIASKHIEIIVRQMTNKVFIKESGDTPFLPNEVIGFSLIHQIYKSFKVTESQIPFKTPKFEPLLLSSTSSSLKKEGFLSSAGFQETKRILTKAALEGSSDWLRGLKECIIIGRIIPAGSAFLNYKNYLDNVYLFKN